MTGERRGDITLTKPLARAHRSLFVEARTAGPNTTLHPPTVWELSRRSMGRRGVVAASSLEDRSVREREVARRAFGLRRAGEESTTLTLAAPRCEQTDAAPRGGTSACNRDRSTRRSVTHREEARGVGRTAAGPKPFGKRSTCRLLEERPGGRPSTRRLTTNGELE